jgi:hypothetical protein
VEGHVAAAIALENLDAEFRNFFRRGNHIRTIGIPPESDDRAMLEKKKYVANSALFAQFYQPLLQAQASSVINRSELDDGNHVLTLSRKSPTH